MFLGRWLRRVRALLQRWERSLGAMFRRPRLFPEMAAPTEQPVEVTDPPGPAPKKREDRFGRLILQYFEVPGAYPAHPIFDKLRDQIIDRLRPLVLGLALASRL